MSTPSAERPEIERLLALAKQSYAEMTPEEKALQHEAQKQSWVRGMMPTGYDWTLEQCEEELAQVEQKITDASGWGARLSVLHGDRDDLVKQIARKQKSR